LAVQHWCLRSPRLARAVPGSWRGRRPELPAALGSGQAAELHLRTAHRPGHAYAWTVTGCGAYLWAAVDEPAGALRMPGSRSYSLARCLDRSRLTPAGVRLVGLAAAQHMVLPGGRGPCRGFLGGGAGRSTVHLSRRASADELAEYLEKGPAGRPRWARVYHGPLWGGVPRRAPARTPMHPAHRAEAPFMPVGRVR
jgi:hypothetical protein